MQAKGCALLPWFVGFAIQGPNLDLQQQQDVHDASMAEVAKALLRVIFMAH